MILVGKSYPIKREIEDLDRLVSMYLDWAENCARRNKLLTTKDWPRKPDGVLEFNAYELHSTHGETRGDQAERHAVQEYEKLRIIQDQECRSDYDKVVDEIKVKKALPKSETLESQGVAFFCGLLGMSGSSIAASTMKVASISMSVGFILAFCLLAVGFGIGA